MILQNNHHFQFRVVNQRNPLYKSDLNLWKLIFFPPIDLVEVVIERVTSRWNPQKVISQIRK